MEEMGRGMRRRPWLSLVVALALTGCAAGQTSPAPGSGSSASGALSTSGASSAPASGASASPSLAAGEFRNPVLPEDFPDPFVLRAGDTYYAYATTDGSANLQIARSSDLAKWEELDDPLPKLPEWSTGDTWAPEVARTSAGYVLYYTARDPELSRPDGGGSQCITTAVSKAPEGPFVDESKRPLVCQPDLGGSIDATYFADRDGTSYLMWKNDGNCCGMPTRFFIQRLQKDGLKLVGKAVDMGVVNDKEWEGGVIEAPTLLLHDGTYYLFYSANGYDTEFYSVGYATAKKVTGPYRDALENPILGGADVEGTRARGPGHQSVVEDDDGELWMAYHAWDVDAVGYQNGGARTMWIDKLVFANGKPDVKGPTDKPQPLP